MRSKRITVMVDVEVDLVVRKLQAKRITDTLSGYSYSRAINELLRKQLKIKDKK